MSASSLLEARFLPSAGLAFGPIAWALNTQLGQILPYADCVTGLRLSAFATLACVLLSLTGAMLSMRSLAAVGGLAAAPHEGPMGMSGFLGLLGTLNGILFTFALLLQGAATLVFTGCER